MSQSSTNTPMWWVRIGKVRIRKQPKEELSKVHTLRHSNSHQTHYLVANNLLLLLTDSCVLHLQCLHIQIHICSLAPSSMHWIRIGILVCLARSLVPLSLAAWCCPLHWTAL
jgi:hypothetical protein